MNDFHPMYVKGELLERASSLSRSCPAPAGHPSHRRYLDLTSPSATRGGVCAGLRKVRSHRLQTGSHRRNAVAVKDIFHRWKWLCGSANAS